MSMSSQKKNIVYEKTGGCCEFCGRKLEFEEMVVTRRVPRAHGGTNATENLIPACLACNRTRGVRIHKELEALEELEALRALERKKKRLRKKRHKRKLKNIQRKQAILDKTNGLCAYCGTVLTLKSMTVDHVISKSRGGGNDLGNLVAACRSCNHLKDSMTLAEFNAINRNRRIPLSRRLRIVFRRTLAALRSALRRLRGFWGVRERLTS